DGLAKKSEVATDKNPSVVLAKNNDNVKGTENVTSANKPEQDARPVVSEVNYPSGEFRINETRVIYVKTGTSYLTIAQRYEIPLARLFEFNDLNQQEITP